MLMTTKTYTNSFIYGLLFLLLLTVVINRIVDPFWYYRDISINGFNAVKTEFHSYEDQIKPIIVKEIRPETMIFSNSYFEIGFNPMHPGLTDNGKRRSYNFGIAAASWDKVYCNVIFALDNTDLKTVIIGIKPEPLPAVDCTMQHKNIVNIEQKTLLLSFDALRGSFNTVRHQYRSPTHTINGMLFYHRNNSSQIEQVFKFYLQRLVKSATNQTCKIPTTTDYPQWSYPKNDEDMEGLKKILELLLNRNVEVKLVIYPNHALWMELTMNCGDIIGRWHSLYQIASVVEGINKNKNIVQLWDFQGTSDFLTERIQNNHVKYWQDHGHFNYEMGDVMLDVIFNDKIPQAIDSSDEFGILLTPHKVIERYYSFFEKRKEFIKQNPWFYEDLENFIK